MSVKDPPRQSMRLLSEWDLANVSSWLDSLSLGQYLSAFEENEIYGSVLAYLNHEILKDLGVESIGHRLKILKSIYGIKQDQDNESTITHDDFGSFIPWDSANTSLFPKSSDNIELNRLLKSLELRDERIMYAENETRRIWDAYQRLREELMPVFRIAKESKPLPTPESNVGTLNSNTDQISKQLHVSSLARNQNPSHLNLSPHGPTVLSPGLASPLPVAPPTTQTADNARSQQPIESPGSVKRMSFISPDRGNGGSSIGGGGGARSNQQLLTNLGNLSSAPSGNRSSMIETNTSAGAGNNVPVSGGGSQSSSSAMHDPFKSFKLSPDDPCSKVLPAVVRKYKIVDDWRMYRLVLSYEGTERVLDLDDKPLAVFKELHSAGKQPFFMLRHVEESAKK